ncbi:MAG TPA: hypothetical protein VKF41_11865 [Bryobacteraceae bacterium]|nr:hypothetical protein [Bryobacteraceae bacterium]
MRAIAALAALAVALTPLAAARPAGKLTMDDRIELVRGLTAEYAKVKVLLPRSRKALEFDAAGTYDKQAWSETAKEYGPAARLGDTIQITKVELASDRIVLQINGGFKGGRKWYQGVQIGAGPSSNPTPVAVGGNDSNAPGGTSIEILFHKPLEPLKAAEIKKMLAPVFDFDLHSATELYAEAIPPAMQQAIKEKRAVEGMTHEQVLLAMGRPREHSRETKDGVELEDWVYGVPPGKITFVTFTGDKVIKVKEEYAGLGTISRDPATLP